MSDQLLDRATVIANTTPEQMKQALFVAGGGGTAHVAVLCWLADVGIKGQEAGELLRQFIDYERRLERC